MNFCPLSSPSTLRRPTHINSMFVCSTIVSCAPMAHGNRYCMTKRIYLLFAGGVVVGVAFLSAAIVIGSAVSRHCIQPNWIVAECMCTTSRVKSISYHTNTHARTM